MTYAETLEYLYNKLPMFSRMGSAAFKKDLTNIRILCERLNNPHQKFKTIHVGGTNGKGSVSHMLAAVFQHAGYKTGLYTSPHLYDFRERIKINGEMLSEKFVVDFTKNIIPVIEEIEPSFFEITVAMAFQYFAEQKVDVAIVEVGLGGRLDSTNIITPQLSIITNIGWDHMNMLGNTLDQIAFEKAGIIKEKVPVVIGESLPETKPVFEKAAAKKKAPLVYAEQRFQLQKYNWTLDSLQVTFQKSNNETVVAETDLQGIYQLKNLATALTALEILQPQFPALRNASTEALKHVKQLTGLKGRWDVIRHKPVVVLDVAHNKNGIEQLLQHVQHLHFNQLHFVIGMVKDKDTDEILNLLPAHAKYYFSHAHIPRALPATELKEKAAGYRLSGNIFENVNDAIYAALASAGEKDLVIVCGSIFLIAEVNRGVVALNEQPFQD